MIKVVSLDFAGTLIDKEYIDYFWLELIPEKYAEKYGLNVSEAKKLIYQEYERVGEDKIEWYLPKYWLEKFNLNLDVRELLDIAISRVHPYPEVFRVIRELSSKYRIIITTNTTLEFIEVFLEKYSEINKYIFKVYSCVSHYGLVRKDRDFYLKLLQDLSVKPEEILHVGDHEIYDYAIPRSLGIKACLIRRNSELNIKLCIIPNLEDLLNVILCM